MFVFKNGLELSQFTKEYRVTLFFMQLILIDNKQLVVDPFIFFIFGTKIQSKCEIYGINLQNHELNYCNFAIPTQTK